MSSKYLYCLIPSNEAKAFAARGIQGDSVHTIQAEQANDLAVVVSDSPLVEYERTRRNMLTHTKVLEEVMSEFTILPIRFGTVAPTEDLIHEKLLTLRHQEFTSLLQNMAGRVELGLKAFWREGTVFADIIAENEEIRRLRDKLQGSDPAKTHFERMRLGEMVEKAVEQKRITEAEMIMSHLEPLAEQVKRKKTFTDQMLVNAAFLVNQTNEAAFDTAIQELDAAMENRLMFKYVGPVPPYNFVNVVLNWN